MFATWLFLFGTVVVGTYNGYYFCDIQLISNSHYGSQSMVYRYLKKFNSNNGKIEVLSAPIYIFNSTMAYYDRRFIFYYYHFFFFYFCTIEKKATYPFFFLFLSSNFNKFVWDENQQFTQNYHIDRCLHAFSNILYNIIFSSYKQSKTLHSFFFSGVYIINRCTCLYTYT